MVLSGISFAADVRPRARTSHAQTARCRWPFTADFGASHTWELSDDRSVTISGGLLFVF